jgi:hypothetical protein
MPSKAPSPASIYARQPKLMATYATQRLRKC